MCVATCQQPRLVRLDQSFPGRSDRARCRSTLTRCHAPHYRLPHRGTIAGLTPRLRPWTAHEGGHLIAVAERRKATKRIANLEADRERRRSVRDGVQEIRGGVESLSCSPPLEDKPSSNSDSAVSRRAAVRKRRRPTDGDGSWRHGLGNGGWTRTRTRTMRRRLHEEEDARSSSSREARPRRVCTGMSWRSRVEGERRA